MRESNFEQVIASSWAFLENLYCHTSELDIFNFINLTDHPTARVLIEEEHEQQTIYLSIELPRYLKNDLLLMNSIDIQALSVIGEELSHFFHLVSAAQRERSISVLQLETLAEIDRFLMFLHWNTFHPHLKLSKKFQNCSQVCDTLFEHRRFNSTNISIYKDAERIALHHLQRAFSYRWTHSHFDTRRFDPSAQAYIAQLFGSSPSELLTA